MLIFIKVKGFHYYLLFLDNMVCNYLRLEYNKLLFYNVVFFKFIIVFVAVTINNNFT